MREGRKFRQESMSAFPKNYNFSALENLIESHPTGIPTGGRKSGGEWNLKNLSGNPSITPEFLEIHPDWKWNMEELSRNPSITLEFIERHLTSFAGQEWDMYNLSLNPSITPEFIESHPNGIP
jgi:hypothetical protein